MRQFKPILSLLFFLTLNNVYANSDRIERPKIYKFIFQNYDTVILNNPNASILKSYSDSIVDNKKRLIEAELFFETGEKLTFKHDGKDWKVIEISVRKMKFFISNIKLKKIPEIHFATVALLWNGSDKKAFKSKYFYIKLEIGKEKSFNKYSRLHLFFSSNEFSESEVSKQINENTEQWTSF